MAKTSFLSTESTTEDAFVCDDTGKSRFCGHCNAYKPDRTHHCSEVGRCFKHVDHFYPWAGGIILEKDIEFFLQFVVHGILSYHTSGEACSAHVDFRHYDISRLKEQYWGNVFLSKHFLRSIIDFSASEILTSTSAKVTDQSSLRLKERCQRTWVLSETVSCLCKSRLRGSCRNALVFLYQPSKTS
jgi:hypothetical protein